MWILETQTRFTGGVWVPQHLGPGGVATVVAAPTGVAATDTANITTALANGGFVLMQAGTYVVNTLNNLLLSNTHWVGAGRDTTTIQYAPGQSGAMLSQTTAITSVTIEGMTFDYNGTNGTGTTTASDAILLQNITRLKLVDCQFQNGRVGCMVGLLQCNDAIVAQNYFLNQGYGGFNCDHLFIGPSGAAGTESNRVQVVGNRFTSCSDSAIVLWAGKASVVQANTIQNFTFNGVVVQGEVGGRGIGHIITGNTIYGPNAAINNSYGVYIAMYDSTYQTALYCNVANNNIAVCANGIRVDGANWTNIVGNTIYSGAVASGASDGIHIDQTFSSATADTQIVSNIIDGCTNGINVATATGVSGLDIYDNHITGATTGLAGASIPVDTHHANNRGIDY